VESAVTGRKRLLQTTLFCGILQFVAACATQYGSIGITGGVEGKMIGPGEAVVVAVGNGYASYQRMQDILMLKSAEMTTDAGFRKFSLLTIEDEGALAASKVSQAKLAEYARQKANTQGNFGPKLNTEATTVMYNNVTGPTVKKAGGGFFVIMYKAGNEGAYDAPRLIAALKTKLVPNPENSKAEKSSQ